MLQLEQFKAADLDCLALVPAEKTEFPVLVFFHGLAQNGKNFLSFAELLSAGHFAVVLPTAPLTVNGLFRSWFTVDPTFSNFSGNVAEARPRFNRIMNEVQERYKVSTGRVAVGGFSIGGMLALDAGLRYKGNDGERPGGVMGFSTAMINDESGDPVEYQEALSLAAKDELPFYVAHGANDPMIPPRLGRATRDSLVKAGVPVEFFSFSGFHEIKPEVVVSARQFLNKIFS